MQIFLIEFLPRGSVMLSRCRLPCSLQRMAVTGESFMPLAISGVHILKTTTGFLVLLLFL